MLECQVSDRHNPSVRRTSEDRRRFKVSVVDTRDSSHNLPDPGNSDYPHNANCLIIISIMKNENHIAFEVKFSIKDSSTCIVKVSSLSLHLFTKFEQKKTVSSRRCKQVGVLCPPSASRHALHGTVEESCYICT